MSDLADALAKLIIGKVEIPPLVPCAEHDAAQALAADAVEQMAAMAEYGPWQPVCSICGIPFGEAPPPRGYL